MKLLGFLLRKNGTSSNGQVFDVGLALNLVIIVIKDQCPGNCELKYLERGRRIFCKSLFYSLCFHKTYYILHYPQLLHNTTKTMPWGAWYRLGKQKTVSHLIITFANQILPRGEAHLGHGAHTGSWQWKTIERKWTVA